MAKLPHLIKKKAIENAAVDGDIIKILEGQSIKAVSAGQDVDLIKVESGVVKALGSEIELKSSSESKLAEAKAYADQIKSDIMGGLPATALDTIKELADAVANDESGIASLVSSVSSLNSGLAQEIADRQSAVNNEASARQAAVNSLQAQISSAVSNASGSLSSDLSSEEAARIAADSALSGRLDVVEGVGAGSISKSLQDAKDYADSKVSIESSARQSADSALDGRVSSIESALPGKASKTYVDTTFETKSAHAADKSAIEASLASEVSRAQAAESDLSSQIGSEITNRVSMVNEKLAEAKTYADGVGAAKLVEAKSYTDGKISDLIGGAPAMMDTLKEISDAISSGESVATALASSLASETSRAQSAEAQALVDAKAYADTKKSEAQSYADAAVLVEKNRAEAAESTLTSSISSEASSRQSADSTITSNLNSEISRAQAEEATLLKLDGSRAMTGILNMGSHKITGLVTPTSNSDAAGKGYVDGQISSEASARTSGDASVTSAFQAADATITSNLNSEISRAQSAESALSTRVDVIEAMSFGKEKLTISGSVPATFTLAQLAHSNSIHCFVGAVPLHEGVGEGFTVSVSGGKSVINFNTDALSVGDKVFFYYHY